MISRLLQGSAIILPAVLALLSLLPATEMPSYPHSASVAANQVFHLRATYTAEHEVSFVVPCPIEGHALSVSTSGNSFVESHPGGLSRLVLSATEDAVSFSVASAADATFVSLNPSWNDLPEECKILATSSRRNGHHTISLQAGAESDSISIDRQTHVALDRIDFSTTRTTDVLAVSATLFAVEESKHSPMTIRLRILAVLSATVAVVAYARLILRPGLGRRISTTALREGLKRIRKQMRTSSALRVPELWRITTIAGVGIASPVFLGPVFDDGWILARAALRHSGTQPLMDPFWNVVQVQGFALESLLAQGFRSSSYLIFFVPNVAAAVGAWILLAAALRRIGLSSDDFASRLGFVIYLMAVPSLTRTLRPEVVVVFLLTAVCLQATRLQLVKRSAGLSVSIPAALAIATHQTGWAVVLSGATVLTLAAFDLTSLPSRAGVAPVAPKAQVAVTALGIYAALGLTSTLILVFWPANPDVLLTAVDDYAILQGALPIVAPHLEWTRIVTAWRWGSVPHLLLSVVGPISTAMLLWRALRSPKKLMGTRSRLSLAVSASGVGLLFTSSKWPHHALVYLVSVITFVAIGASQRPSLRLRDNTYLRRILLLSDRHIVSVSATAVLALCAWQSFNYGPRFHLEREMWSQAPLQAPTTLIAAFVVIALVGAPLFDALDKADLAQGALARTARRVWNQLFRVGPLVLGSIAVTAIGAAAASALASRVSPLPPDVVSMVAALLLALCFALLHRGGHLFRSAWQSLLLLAALSFISTPMFQQLASLGYASEVTLSEWLFRNRPLIPVETYRDAVSVGLRPVQALGFAAAISSLAALRGKADAWWDMRRNPRPVVQASAVALVVSSLLPIGSEMVASSGLTSATPTFGRTVGSAEFNQDGRCGLTSAYNSSSNPQWPTPLSLSGLVRTMSPNHVPYLLCVSSPSFDAGRWGDTTFDSVASYQRGFADSNFCVSGDSLEPICFIELQAPSVAD